MNTIAISPSSENTTAVPSTFTKSLQELMEDGIYLLFLLRNANPPNTLVEFHRRIDQFFAQFDANARHLDKPPSAVSDAKYAFCEIGRAHV